MKSLFGAVLLLGAMPWVGTNAASSYPDQSIRLVIPFSAGGPSDVLARSYAEGLGRELGQTIVVENKPGAGGNIGSAFVAKAPPDGYSLVLGMVGTHAINYGLYPDMPYSAADFAPVSIVGSAPIVVVAHPGSGFKTIKDLIDHKKANGAPPSYASPGAGTPQHLTGEMLKQQANVELVHVPYRGGAPALNDVLGGHVPLAIISLPAALPHIRKGSLNALGVASAQRSPIATDIATIAESGLPGFEVDNWYGVFAPAGTPASVIEKLNLTLGKLAQDPMIQQRLADAGFVTLHDTPSQFAAYVKAEVVKWKDIVKVSGATAQ